jgi:hypothetical protein
LICATVYVTSLDEDGTSSGECPKCGSAAKAEPEKVVIQAEAWLPPRGLKRPEEPCTPTTHTPILSEPSLTLCCARCGSWLKATRIGYEDAYRVVARAEATRGEHRCPVCEKTWMGDSDWCEDCERPTWADDIDKPTSP